MFDLSDSREQIRNRDYKAHIGCDGTAVQPQTDMLVDITIKLGEARLEAEALNDKLFLYLIDVAIFHAHEVLERQPDLGEQEKWS